jgi:hypothetical protein
MRYRGAKKEDCSMSMNWIMVHDHLPSLFIFAYLKKEAHLVAQAESYQGPNWIPSSFFHTDNGGVNFGK